MTDLAALAPEPDPTAIYRERDGIFAVELRRSGSGVLPQSSRTRSRTTSRSCVWLDGFTLPAATRAGGATTRRAARRCCDVLRRPVALERLEQRPFGLVRIILKKAACSRRRARGGRVSRRLCHRSRPWTAPSPGGRQGPEDTAPGPSSSRVPSPWTFSAVQAVRGERRSTTWRTTSSTAGLRSVSTGMPIGDATENLPRAPGYSSSTVQADRGGS